MSIQTVWSAEQFTDCTSAQINPYGHLPGTVKPIKPPLNEFDINLKEVKVANLPIYLPLTQVPPVRESEAPPGRTYPVSPVWTLETDKGYRTQQCYSTDVTCDRMDKETQRRHQMSLLTPPDIDPLWDDKQHKFVDQIPGGMVKMTAGIPYRLNVVEGTVTGQKTFACFHTLKSLDEMYPDVGAQMRPLAESLHALSFGRAETAPGKDDRIRPFYTYEYLKQNQRSHQKGKATQVEAGVSAGYDGSYSLASTIQQGSGVGTVVPTSQAGYPAVRKHLEELLGLLRQMFLLLMPLMITNFEWLITQFHLDDNNVFSFGGLRQAFISVQMNISSFFNGLSLFDILGRQGSWHTDADDDEAVMGMFALLLRLPPGLQLCSWCPHYI